MRQKPRWQLPPEELAGEYLRDLKAAERRITELTDTLNTAKATIAQASKLNREFTETSVLLIDEIEAVARGAFGMDWADTFGPLFARVEALKDKCKEALPLL